MHAYINVKHSIIYPTHGPCMQQTPLHFGVVTHKLLLCICMHECHVGLYSLHTQYNSRHIHTHAWWYSGADENIPNWHSCNNVAPMHKPLGTNRFKSLHV